MIKARWKRLAGNIRRIEKLWEAREAVNATAEPEWPEYEDYLYAQAEIVCRCSTWRSRGIDPITGELHA